MTERVERRRRRGQIGQWMDLGSFALGVMTEAMAQLRAEALVREEARRRAGFPRAVPGPPVVPLSAGSAPWVVPGRRRTPREDPALRPPRRRRPEPPRIETGSSEHS